MTAIPVVAAAPVERTPTRVLVRFGLGDFAQAVLTGLITSYVMVVFIPQAHSSLPVLLPAAALTFALVRGVGSGLDAFLNPFVASWSDRIRARGGRRTSMLRWAALPWAATTALIVFTPLNHASGWNTVWVAVFLSLYYATGTFFLVPYFALVAELVSEVRRRVWFYTINTLFFVIGSAVVFVTPTLQSLLVGAGFSELAAWRFSFALFAGVGFLAAVIPAFTIDERRYVGGAASGVASHQPLLASFAATFRYPNFRVLVSATFVMQVAFALFNATLLYYITMLVGQPQAFTTLVLIIAIIVGVSAYPLVNWLARKVGKKPLMVGACVAYVVIYFAIYLYRYALEGIPGPLFAILIGVVIGVPISITNIIPPAAFADLTQYDTLKTGLNRAGMFFASRSFVTSLSGTFVLLVVPGLISLGSTDGRATVAGVQLTALVSGVFIAAALVLFAFYDDRHVIAAIEGHGGTGPDASAERPDAAGSPVRIERVAWDDPRAVELRAAMDAEIGPRYADLVAGLTAQQQAVRASAFVIDPATVTGVYLALDGDGTPLGHAALRRLELAGEIEWELKRLVTLPAARGRGVGAALVAAVEADAHAADGRRIVLQTGTRQPEAVGLYEKLGYRPVEAYPPYAGKVPEGLYFAKEFSGA